MDLGNKVCDNENAFGNLVDSLYFLIYENLEHIKLLIGDGDKKKGDAKVREEDVYQCIFRIKDIRSDLRHDLEHGSEKEKEKKRKRTVDAFQHYGKKRPRTASEYRNFQLKIYSDVSRLMGRLWSVYSNDDSIDGGESHE